MENALEDGEIGTGGAFFPAFEAGSDFASSHDGWNGQWSLPADKQQVGQAPMLRAGTDPRHPWTHSGGHDEPYLDYSALNDTSDHSRPDMSGPEPRAQATYEKLNRQTGEFADRAVGTSWSECVPQHNLYGYGDAHQYVDRAAEAGTSCIDHPQQNHLGTDFYASAWEEAPRAGDFAYDHPWQVSGGQWHDGAAVSGFNPSVRGLGQEGQVYAYGSVDQEAHRGHEQAPYTSWDQDGPANPTNPPTTSFSANQPPDTALSGLLNVSGPTGQSESKDEPARKGFKKPDKTRLVLGKNKPIVQANFLPKLSSGGITKPRPKKAESKYEAEKRKYQSRMND